jgi:two-component system cell cycle sensor histidine kinase/response regulator CckA
VVVSASQIGARTARMALEILEGRQVSTLPIEQAPAPRTVFDYDKLTEVGMDVKALPAGAEILNQPASFFQEHRWWLLLGGGGVAALLIALALLLAHAVRRARVQRELQRRGDLLHSVLSHVPNYVYWKDREGVYRGCNENYARLLGLDGPEAIVGLTDHDLSWPVDQRKSSIRGDEQIVRSGQPALNAQEDLLLDRGPLRNVVRSRVPIIDKDGRVCGVLGMLLDITESKQLESRLRQSQKMEAIGQLAGGIAHDFNNLLAVIQGNAQLLQMFDSCKTGEDAGMVQEIVQASRRASSLTRQLLDFARKSDLRKEWTDVHTSVGEVVHMLTHSLDRKIEIRQELKARSPSLLVDPAQMQNAILNLCVNARDAMPSGGVLRICTEEVTLDRDFCARQREESIRPGRYLRITVSDTGVGISRDVQNRIFEPFFTTKEVGKGTGLGLAGVYGFVKSQQGLAKVESKVGQGTEMHLLLPLDASAQQSSTVEQQSEEQESGRLPQGRGRILIVDDEEMVRRFAAKALANLGYEVIEACDAATAQRAFHEAQEGFDLVLMDLILPKVGGEELFARLRKIRPDAQVLVMSGYSKKHVVDDLLQRGASGFLAKPFTLEALAESVSETLGGSRLRMQAS